MNGKILSPEDFKKLGFKPYKYKGQFAFKKENLVVWFENGILISDYIKPKGN